MPIVKIDMDKQRAPIPPSDLTTEQHVDIIMEEMNIFGVELRRKLFHHLVMAEWRGWWGEIAASGKEQPRA